MKLPAHPVELPPVDHQPADGWRDHAACADTPTADWFPPQGTTRAHVDRLKAICAECPVRIDCLTVALDLCEKFGFSGGTSERERRFLRRNWPRTACATCRTELVPVALPRRNGTPPSCTTCTAKESAA